MLKQLYALYGPTAPVFFSEPTSIDMLGIAGWNQTDRQSTVKEITRDPRQWRQQLLKRLKSSEYVYCSEWRLCAKQSCQTYLKLSCAHLSQAFLCL